jgi:hypothetical protein
LEQQDQHLEQQDQHMEHQQHLEHLQQQLIILQEHTTPKLITRLQQHNTFLQTLWICKE